MFKITKRHYDLIIHQALANYPQESGGFLGGRDFVIQAILPVFNQYLYDRQNTFAVSADDKMRAYKLFEKHHLEYFGCYHTHPNGAPIPSKQDLKNKDKFHFIIGLKNPKKPLLCVYSFMHGNVEQIPITVVPTEEFSIVDIHAKPSEISPHWVSKGKTLEQEMSLLYDQMEAIKHNKTHYQKGDPMTDQSSFSTSA